MNTREHLNTWIPHPNKNMREWAQCSNCWASVIIRDKETGELLGLNTCPKCGAEMEVYDEGIY